MVSYGNMGNDKCRGLRSISKGEEEQTKKIITLMCISSVQIRLRVQENFYDKCERTYHSPKATGKKDVAEDSNRNLNVQKHQ